jgi:hypothetical protein
MIELYSKQQPQLPSRKESCYSVSDERMAEIASILRLFISSTEAVMIGSRG